MDRAEVGWLVVVVVAVGVVTAVIAVRLAFRLVRARRVLKETGMPLSTKAMFWGSIAYLICPVDLLPDPIYLDDIGFLMLALRSVHAAAARLSAQRALPSGGRRENRTYRHKHGLK